MFIPARGRVARLARHHLPLLLLLLLSCSKDEPAGPGTPPGPQQPPPTGDITQTIQPGGGAIAATSNEGAIVTLTFPAGAVGSPVNVSVKPRTPESGTWANIVVEPKDVVFFKDIQVALRIPNGMDIDATHQIFMGSTAAPMLRPTTLNVTARTLTTTIRLFGASAGDEVGMVPRSAAADIGNNISARAVGCQEHIQAAQQAIDDLIATGTFESALAAASAAASIAARTDCAAAEEWVTATAQLACDSLSEALSGASIAGYGDYHRAVAPIIYWAAVARALDPGCSALAQVTSTVSGLDGQLLVFFQTSLGSLVADSYGAFNNLKDEARSAHKIFTEALALGEDATAMQLQDEALFPALNSFRDRAYSLCASDTWHYPLSRLTSVGFYADRDETGVPAPNNPVLTESAVYGPFTDMDIWDDLQLCGTSLSVTTNVTSGPMLAQEVGGGGATPGDKLGAIDIRTPTRGELTIDGSIIGFTCWNDVVGDNQLAFEIDGVPVLTLNRSGDEYITSPAVFDLQSMANQAGVVLNDGQRVTMRLMRKRTGCDDRLWGSSDAQVVAINMDLEGPGLSITAPLASTVQPGQVIDLQIQVEVTDQLGGTSFEPGVHVDVSAIGGTASPTSGETDASGIFSTQITVAQPFMTMGGMQASAAELLVSIAALLDGVLENELLTATIEGNCDITGSVTVNSQEEVDALAGACSISRSLTIQDDGSGSPITDLTPLSSLTYVGEGISILSTSLANLDGLQNVSLDEGASFALQGNANLVDVDSLASSSTSPIRRMGLVWFQDNAMLTNIDGIQNLMMQTGVRTSFVTLSGNPMLTSLAGLARVDTVDQALSIVDNDGLTTLAGLEGLVSIANLTISGNAMLSSVSSLTGAEVTQSLSIEDNSVLLNLDGFESVTSLAAVLEIINNPELANIDGLANLANVGNALTITGNAKLCTIPSWVDALSPPTKVVQNNGTDPSCSPVN